MGGSDVTLGGVITTVCVGGTTTGGGVITTGGGGVIRTGGDGGEDGHVHPPEGDPLPYPPMPPNKCPRPRLYVTCSGLDGTPDGH